MLGLCHSEEWTIWSTRLPPSDREKRQQYRPLEKWEKATDLFGDHDGMGSTLNHELIRVDQYESLYLTYSSFTPAYDHRTLVNMAIGQALWLWSRTSKHVLRGLSPKQAAEPRDHRCEGENQSPTCQKFALQRVLQYSYEKNYFYLPGL